MSTSRGAAMPRRTVSPLASSTVMTMSWPMTKLCWGRRLSTSMEESFLLLPGRPTLSGPAVEVCPRGAGSGREQRLAQREGLAGEDDLCGVVRAGVDDEGREGVGGGVGRVVAQGDDQQHEGLLLAAQGEPLDGLVVDHRCVVREEGRRGDHDEVGILLRHAA